MCVCEGGGENACLDGLLYFLSTLKWAIHKKDGSKSGSQRKTTGLAHFTNVTCSLPNLKVVQTTRAQKMSSFKTVLRVFIFEIIMQHYEVTCQVFNRKGCMFLSRRHCF